MPAAATSVELSWKEMGGMNALSEHIYDLFTSCDESTYETLQTLPEYP